jgi:hypothetical protein
VIKRFDELTFGAIEFTDSPGEVGVVIDGGEAGQAAHEGRQVGAQSFPSLLEVEEGLRAGAEGSLAERLEEEVENRVVFELLRRIGNRGVESLHHRFANLSPVLRHGSSEKGGPDGRMRLKSATVAAAAVGGGTTSGLAGMHSE